MPREPPPQKDEDSAPEPPERAGSPPEVASLAHSAVSLGNAEVAHSPTPAARAPSIASVRSARASEVSLADRAEPAAHSAGERAASLEVISTERVPPATQSPSPPPPPPTDVLDGQTTSSQVDLATENPEPAEAERAGSPPEVGSPKHSDVQLAEGRQSPGAAAGRAGSPSEALTPQHSDVDVAEAAPQDGPQGPERAGSPPEAGADTAEQ
ncbi:fibrous sheath CABYR-binding protein-like [Amphibalanus amphitrite]|nr:fibrous sheath CABYR-binding protein-like [Amphibalanus amphitrite]